MAAMLVVVFCYTICNVSDKYVISKVKMNGNEFTFIMAISSAVFLCILFPLTKLTMVWNINTLLTSILIALAKLLEFKSSAVLLKSLSAFQLKAWLGIGMFLSYGYEIIFKGEPFRLIRILYLLIILFGLYLISGNQEEINYKKIWFYIVSYIISKFAYGLIINKCPSFQFSITSLVLALFILSLILVFSIKPKEMLQRNPKGTVIAIATKLPNAVGLLVENTAALVSLTAYSLIQPLILAALFFVDLIQTSTRRKKGIVGSILCIVGVLCFQLL